MLSAGAGSDDLSRIGAVSALGADAGEWPSPSESDDEQDGARTSSKMKVESKMKQEHRASKLDADGWPMESDEDAPKETPRKAKAKNVKSRDLQESACKVAKSALPGSAKGLAEHIKATSTRRKCQAYKETNKGQRFQLRRFCQFAALVRFLGNKS